jgi:starvation-inducible DNA-binding protein
MPSTSTVRLPALSEHIRNEVANELQATLVELIDLSLFGKQLHWAVIGPHFRSLHLQLDELVDGWRELSDKVAERAVALGVIPDGQAATVAAASPAPLASGQIADQQVVREIEQRIADAAERCRERMVRLGDFDSVSEDLMIEVVGDLEQALWMVRAQFPVAEQI